MASTTEDNFGACGCAIAPGRRDKATGIVDALSSAAASERLAAEDGLLQRLDPRAKVVGVLSLVLAAVFVDSLVILALLFTAAFGLAVASRIPVRRLAGQVWTPVLLFSGLLALPAVFLVPGDIVGHLPLAGWAVTEQGLRGAAFMFGRAETASSFTLLLILTTPWTHVLKALRLLGVPVAAVALLGMTHRFIFLLLETGTQMFEAKKSRTLGRLSRRQRRRVAIDIAGSLLLRAMQLSEDVHLAMVARGYRGEVYVLDEFRATGRDWIGALALVGLSVAAVAASLTLRLA
jgi:cobalt/nickel transport system permease protein